MTPEEIFDGIGDSEERVWEVLLTVSNAGGEVSQSSGIYTWLEVNALVGKLSVDSGFRVVEVDSDFDIADAELHLRFTCDNPETNRFTDIFIHVERVPGL